MSLGSGDSLLTYGSALSLFSRESGGFVSAEGFSDGNLRVIPDATGLLYTDFKDCVFRLIPAQRFAAQAAYRKALRISELELRRRGSGRSRGGGEHGGEHGGGGGDSHGLRRYKELAKAEMRSNQETFERLAGTVVQFGAHVQLVHSKSSKFVTVSPRELWCEATPAAVGV